MKKNQKVQFKELFISYLKENSFTLKFNSGFRTSHIDIVKNDNGKEIRDDLVDDYLSNTIYDVVSFFKFVEYVKKMLILIFY